MVVDQIVQQIQPPQSLIAPTPIATNVPTTPELQLAKPKFDEQVLAQIVNEMDQRRKDWLKEYKTKLDLNDVLEIRNP